MTTANDTLRSDMNDSDLNNLQNNLQRVRFGNMLSIAKVVATGLTAAASFDITTAAFKAFCVITGIELRDGETLPPIRHVRSLRVTASGTANSVGSYGMSDASGTAVSPTAGANMGVALVSDDGKTITFPSTVTAFVIEYGPAPAISLDTLTNSF